MTDQKTPDGTQERLKGGCATPAPPEGLNGPQTGAQPRGLVDWARHYAAQREQQAAAEAWTPLRARAFNAVQPALRQAGEWLPLSARRAVADAVLAELKQELDALAEYENTINWMTTCTSCARILDSAYAETVRAEKAGATLAAVRAVAAELFVTGATETERAVGRRVLSALTEPEPHNAGPTVAECAQADRVWPLQKEGL